MVRAGVLALGLLVCTAETARGGPGQFSPPTPEGESRMATLEVTANVDGVIMYATYGSTNPRILTCALPCTLTLPQGVAVATQYALPQGYTREPSPPIAWVCKGLLSPTCKLSPDKIDLHLVKQHQASTTDIYSAPSNP